MFNVLTNRCRDLIEVASGRVTTSKWSRNFRGFVSRGLIGAAPGSATPATYREMIIRG
jgi:hypothetical protein